MLINEKLKERNLKLDSQYEARWMDRQMLLEDLGLDSDNLDKAVDMLAGIAEETKKMVDNVKMNHKRLKLIDEESTKFIEKVKIVIEDDSESDVMKFYNIAMLTRICEHQVDIYD